MTDSACFLPWEIEDFEEERAYWEKLLQPRGVNTNPDIGRKWQAFFALAMIFLNTSGISQRHRVLARIVGVPRDRAGKAGRLEEWIRDHWHKEHVRWAVVKFCRRMSMPSILQPAVEPAAVERDIADELNGGGTEGSALLLCLVSLDAAKDPNAEAVVRQAFGPERWDQLVALLEAEARPVLWFAMLLPDIDRVQADQAAQHKARGLTRRGAELSWQANAQASKHQKASSRLAELEQLVAAAHQELLEREEELRSEQERTAQEIAALLDGVAEERTVWQELLAATQVATVEAPALPLAGRRVLIVGGDPIATGALALVRALGAARAEACPGFDEERRFAQALEGAEVVIAVTAYMAHAHSYLLRAEMDRRELPVVWVNHMGLHALQRAVVETLG